jgi:carbonic anhydrase
MSAQSIKRLFENNRRWSKHMTEDNPAFFETLAHQQSPDYLWIGCADSRVPANEIIGLLPGEVFVHRNVANVINHTDLNALTVMQYAVDVLKVSDIMVVGHYGCGGVQCTLESTRVGLADNWLRHVQDVQIKHQDLLDQLPKKHRLSALCELNVLEQVANAARTTVVCDAWKRGQALTLHAWVYGLQDGRVRDLGLSIHSSSGLLNKLNRAAKAVQTRWS